jgi:hypothetical protein
MKYEYKKPVVKLIDYAYQEQVVASSSEDGIQVDGIGNGQCTWSWPGCEFLYTTGCTVPVPDAPTL